MLQTDKNKTLNPEVDVALAAEEDGGDDGEEVSTECIVSLAINC